MNGSLGPDQAATSQAAPLLALVQGAQGVQLGLHNEQHNYFVQQGRERSVHWPCQVGLLPMVADSYQIREDLAAQLDAAVDHHAQPVILGQVLSGMGGVGKTQAAAWYARRRWDRREVDVLIWITASSRDAIVSAYAHAADELGVDHTDDVQRAVTRFRSWLAVTERRWLIVYDDLASPAVLRDLWPPESPTGQVLVTTRRRDAALLTHGRVLVDVGVFTANQALDYLRRKLTTGADDRQPEEALELAEDLGFLPLAIAQAAAYIQDRTDDGMDCRRYRRQLSDRRRDFTDSLPEPDSLPDDHRETVTATFAMSIERANRLRPAGLARPILELISVLDSNGIPVSLCTTKAALAHCSLQTDRPIGESAALDALGTLRRLSLISRAPGTDPLIRVHGLVQRVCREQLDQWRINVITQVAADSLIECWPRIAEPTAISQILRANAAALRHHNEAALLQPNAHEVLHHFGDSLGQSGHYLAAIDYFKDLHDVLFRQIGAVHGGTLRARHRLAYWQGCAGDPAGAVVALESLLGDRIRLLGADHSDTLDTLGDLACSRGEAGDQAGAVTALASLVHDYTRVLGADHPTTLSARHNLARWRREAGDTVGAIADLEHVLVDRLRILGEDDPNTLTTRHNLAYLRGEAGDAAGAVAELEHVVAARTRILGPDHVRTLVARHNFAVWRGRAGQPEVAAHALEQLHADFVRALGPDHSYAQITLRSADEWKDLVN